VGGRIRLSTAASSTLAFATLACAREPEPAAPSPDATSRRNAPAGELVGFLGAYGSHA
jgi:hypothetical protein